MKETKISIKNKVGESLVGLKTANESSKAVILVHGFGVTKAENGMFDELAERISSEGFVVYRFDFSGGGESEGDCADMTLGKLRDDLFCILGFVRGQGHKKIGIMAQSFGTSVTIALAPDVDALVLMGSFGNCHEFFKGNVHVYEPQGISKRIKRDGRVISLKPSFWEDFTNHDLFESMKKIVCPVLFIHGGADTIIPLKQGQRLYELANEPKDFVVLEGANHSLLPKREEMTQAIIKWFAKWL